MLIEPILKSEFESLRSYLFHSVINPFDFHSGSKITKLLRVLSNQLMYFQ